jgi:hypothetical protein
MTAIKPKRLALTNQQFIILLIFLTIAGIAISHWLMQHYQLCGPPHAGPCAPISNSAEIACPSVGYPCRPEIWAIGTLVLPLSSAAYLIFLAVKQQLKS